MSIAKTLRPRILIQAICLALLNGAASAQDDQPAPKSDSPAAEKEASKEKKPQVTPRDEATALKEFKADMLKIKEWTESQDKDDEANPAAGIRKITEIASRMGKVRTDGLPEDIAKPMKRMNTLLSKMAGYFTGAPEKDEEFANWMAGKIADPEFVKQMQEEMPKLGAQLEKTGKQLKKVAAKYGMDELDFGEKKSGDEDEDGKKPEEDKDGDKDKDKDKDKI